VLRVSDMVIAERNGSVELRNEPGLGLTRVAPPALRNKTRTYLGKGLGELPFVARLAVDLRFVVVWADHNL
jgi:hypothetical protein